MGFWGDLIGIGGDIAGAFVGMPWLGTAATAIGGAINSSDASKKAAQTQVQGAQQAQQNFAPFQQVGNQALSKLSSMYGLTVPQAGTAVPMMQPPRATPIAAGPTYGMATTPNLASGPPPIQLPLSTLYRPPSESSYHGEMQ